MQSRQPICSPTSWLVVQPDRLWRLFFGCPLGHMGMADARDVLQARNEP